MPVSCGEDRAVFPGYSLRCQQQGRLYFIPLRRVRCPQLVSPAGQQVNKWGATTLAAEKGSMLIGLCPSIRFGLMLATVFHVLLMCVVAFFCCMADEAVLQHCMRFLSEFRNLNDDFKVVQHGKQVHGMQESSQSRRMNLPLKFSKIVGKMRIILSPILLVRTGGDQKLSKRLKIF